jgi:ferric-dicitrate binding protein FerR (iron transport regulator)
MNGTGRFEVTRLDGDELARRLGWRSGWLWFSGKPVRDVVAEFNRYSSRRLVIVDPSIEEKRISGRYRLTGVDQFVAALGEHGISARRAGSGRDHEIQLSASPQ